MLARLLAVEPNDVEALRMLSLAQSDDDPAGSYESAQRVLSLDPSDVQALLLCADACLGCTGSTTRCATPGSPWPRRRGWRRRMQHWRRRSGVAVAATTRPRQAARRAIELDPEQAIGYIAAGNIEIARGEWHEAERWYRKALEVDPSDNTAQVNLVTAHESSGRISPAFSEATALLRLDPSDRWALKVLHETVYTTLVHLLWVATVILFVAAVITSE